MFASQLLRILQTIPGDVNYETCDFEAPEVKLTMKENQNENLCHSNSFEREASPSAFWTENGHDFWIASAPECSEVVDRRTDSDNKEARDFRMVGDQEGPLCHSNGCKRGLGSSDDKVELWSSPKFERSIIVDSSIDRGEKESGDSETLHTAGSPLFESDSDMHFYTDKSVRECELPDVIACYRENNYHIVKDICVDEGLPTQDKTLTEMDKVGHAGLFVSQPCGEDKHSGTTKGCHDIEPIPDGLTASTVEDILHNASDDCGTKEGVNSANFSLDGPKSSLEDYAGKNTSTESGPGNLTQMGEANWSSTDRTVEDVSEEESATSSSHTSQELIIQDSLLCCSNCDGTEAPKQLDEVPSVEAILESLAVAFTTEDSKKNGAATDLPYNSKVDGGTITFDFNSSKPAGGSGTDGSAENSHEESLKSEDLPNHKHGYSNDYPVATLVESASGLDKNEKVHEPKTQSEDVAGHSSLVQRGELESSFSSSGPLSALITFSGPIAYSGSISLRSDSSTTSTRSFAFPVLQNEWNSSPVRMVKADRRHFRKQRGWRQGLFCCRF